jgi:hypothetical protein
MNESVELTYTTTLQTLIFLCQSPENVKKLTSADDFLEQVIAAQRDIINKAFQQMENDKTNALKVDDLFVIRHDESIMIELPKFALGSPVGNSILFHNDNATLIHLENESGNLSVDEIPAELTSSEDKVLISAVGLIIRSILENVPIEDTAETLAKFVSYAHEINNSKEEDREKVFKSKLGEKCYISTIMNDALNKNKVPKTQEENFIKFIALVSLELDNSGKFDFRDFVISHQKSANYYNFIQKHRRTNILFTYDSELDYLFITDKNTDVKYNKEDYESEDEYQKILVVEGLLKSIAGKIKAKEFFDSIS